MSSATGPTTGGVRDVVITGSGPAGCTGTAETRDHRDYE